MMFGRKKLRLENYNYSDPGYYFVTILVKDMECLFGLISNGNLKLNECGEAAKKCWEEIPLHYDNVDIDEFIIMPNHIHGIIIIHTVGVGHCPTPTYGIYGKLSKIINAYKNLVTKKIKEIFPDKNFRWHRSFYDHIIRHYNDLDRIRKYIKYNYLRG